MLAEKWLEKHPLSPVTVPLGASLEAAGEALLAEPAARDLYVLDPSGRPCGHLSLRQIAGLLLAAERPTHSRRQLIDRIAFVRGPVEDYMDSHVLRIGLDERISDVLHHFMERRIEDIPVLGRDGCIVGVIRLRDLLAARLAHWARANGHENFPEH
ncbi:MAG: CBS domain-containing protein [Halothiobacillaceae bacterium]